MARIFVILLCAVTLWALCSESAADSDSPSEVHSLDKRSPGKPPKPLTPRPTQGQLRPKSVPPTNKELGPPLQRCTQDDPNVNECLRNSIQSAIRSLKDGYAPFGMVPLDPLVIEQLVLVSPENKKCDLNKYDVVGLKNVVCEKASFSVTGDKSFRLSFDLLLPQFDAAGTYNMERGFLGNKKANQGSFTFNLTDYRADFVLDGLLSPGSDGQEHATLSGVSSSFNGGVNFRVHFTNLSNGLNKLWNREPEGVLQGYKTAIDQLHPILAQTYSNLLFQKVPFADLFPPTKTSA